MGPILELRNVTKSFGTVLALRNLQFDVAAGEVHCLLGDNGAGKSTVIKILSGVYRMTEGQYLIDGQVASIASPRDALDRGVATVFQDLALVPLMSITRNFFMGRELTKGRGLFSRFDIARANEVVLDALSEIGIDVRDPTQAVGTLSGGERQCLAIARAVHFGARLMPTPWVEDKPVRLDGPLRNAGPAHRRRLAPQPPPAWNLCYARRTRTPGPGQAKQGVRRWAGVHDNDTLVATAAEAWSSTDVGFMMGVAVHPSHTGQGLGQRICQFVTSSLLTLYGTCALFVENHNAPAIALYRKLGFAYRDVTTLLPAV